MKLGIIGGGVVGHATGRAFLEHHEVRVYDVAKERSTHTFNEVLTESGLTFLCLPTPPRQGSLEFDTTTLDEVLQKIAYQYRDPGSEICSLNLVIKSTVPVGYTRSRADRFKMTNLVHSPEFLTARCSVTDAHLPARNIIGSPRPGTDCGRALVHLFLRRFPGVPILGMLSDESELVKLATNAFFAVKVAFLNEVNYFASARGLNWEQVLRGILTDGRISHAHTKVPGPDGRYGFGGDCLPKDLANLAAQLGPTAGLVCNAALQRNEQLDRKRS